VSRGESIALGDVTAMTEIVLWPVPKSPARLARPCRTGELASTLARRRGFAG